MYEQTSQAWPDYTQASMHAFPDTQVNHLLGLLTYVCANKQQGIVRHRPYHQRH